MRRKEATGAVPDAHQRPYRIQAAHAHPGRRPKAPCLAAGRLNRRQVASRVEKLSHADEHTHLADCTARSGQHRHRLCLVHAAAQDRQHRCRRPAPSVHRQRRHSASCRRLAHRRRQALERPPATANNHSHLGRPEALCLERRTEVAMTDLTWLESEPLPELMAKAARRRDEAFGRSISYSRKVFIPLTKLCRDVCHYCTFAERPRAGRAAYLSADEILAIARAGEAAGCTEALFTLGDKPELRYRPAREALAELGHATTISYLGAMCALVLKETSLLPHVNPGVMTREEIAALREVSASQGIMLESTSERLCQQGGVHYGSPDKLPAVRLETIRLAGELAVPFTTGILIGIGETRVERLDALEAIRDLHRTHGHIQEVIVQNFRAKPKTKRANAPEPDLGDLLWTIAAARLILPADVHVQAPPNLSPGVYQKLIGAGIDDWGGVSPVTPDHVNPEAPWPAIAALAERTASFGKILVPRLPVYPAYAHAAQQWLAPAIATRVRRAIDADGWARDDDWAPGLTTLPRQPAPLLSQVDPQV